jgi:hypothetical protein
LPLRGYVIGVIILLVLLAATTALGAGIGLAISSFSDSDIGRVIGIGLGSFFGFVFGAGMCYEATKFTIATLQSRKSSETSTRE